jgi:OOP family OmpA-OmpF porin
MKGRISVVAAALALGSSCAFAQHAGPYIGASFGQTKADIDEGALDRDLRSAGFTTNGVRSDETDTGFKAFGGYRFNRNFALEASYLKLGEISANTTITNVAPPANVKATFSWEYGFAVEAVGILPVGNQLDLFGKLGGYMVKTKLKVDVQGAGSASLSDTDTNTGLTYGIGAQYNFTPNFAVRTEWQQFKDVGTDKTGGSGDVSFLSVGILYRFR